MRSRKAFINGNRSQKIAPWSTAIFPYFTALMGRKLSLRLTGCHIKEMFLFTGPLFGSKLLPQPQGGSPLQHNGQHCVLQPSAANVLTRGCRKSSPPTPWPIMDHRWGVETDTPGKLALHLNKKPLSCNHSEKQTLLGSCTFSLYP